MLFRWTGAGWLSPVFVIASFFAGAVVGGALGGGFDGDATTAVLLVAVVMAALAPVHWLIGRALNSSKGPEGRYWVDRHTYAGVPVERAAIAQVVLALALASFVVGRATSAWLGWTMFVGVLVVVMLARGRQRWRRWAAGVADRAELAQSRGWRYRERVAGLTVRWKGVFGRKAYSMSALGVLGGELNGYPFTVFDTEASGMAEVQTILVVHLPASYPRTSVRIDRPPVGAELPRLVETGATVVEPYPVRVDDVRAHGENVDFGRELLTHAVREVTARHQLSGWHIEGRDLLLSQPLISGSPLTAGQVLQRVGQLVDLARTFPADVAARYGAEPAQDIPKVG